MATTTATSVSTPKVNRNYNRVFRIAWNVVNGGKIIEHRIRELKTSVPTVDYQRGIYNVLLKYSLTQKRHIEITENSIISPKGYKYIFRELTTENMKKFVDELFINKSEVFNNFIHKFASRELLEYVGATYDCSKLENEVYERGIMMCFTRPSIIAWRFASKQHRK
jgi:hypothetical protein